MSASAENNSGIAETLREIRERITKQLQRPHAEVPQLRLPSVEPLKEAQAAASRLAEGIGAINPRPPGLANDLVQGVKRACARLLDWQVRPQREFNRRVVESLASVSELLEATNSNLMVLAEVHRQFGEAVASWRENSEQRLASLSEHVEEQLASLWANFEEQMKRQRWAYDGVLARQSVTLQDRTFELLGEVREQLHDELRLVRQRVAAQSQAIDALRAVRSAAPPRDRKTVSAEGIDYFQMEQHFRGAEEEVRDRQSFYLPFFRGRRNVLDIACGRGEFLELMRQAAVPARGIDLSADMVGHCLGKGLDVVQEDAFAYLDTVPDRSLDGIFCSQFVEHLEPEAYVALISRCAAKLAPAGILAVETPNPECLAIFSQTFFLDPTHIQPIPPAQLKVLFVEAGLTEVTIHFLSPAAARLPAIPKLESHAIEADTLKAWNAAVTRFNETFFGGMDYAVLGYKPDTVSRAASPHRGVSAE